MTLELPEMMTVSLNLTNIHFDNMYIDNQEKLAEILDHRAVFAIRDFCASLKGEYMYISDPPLFADMGIFEFDLQNLTIKMDGSNKFVDDILEVNINDFEFDVLNTTIKFDGVSDMSDVTSRLLNFVVSLVNNRL